MASTQPSAPPADDTFTIRQVQIETLQAPAPPVYGLGTGQDPNSHNLPPPSYSEAMNYPSVPPYPSYQPNLNNPKSTIGPNVAPQVYPQYPTGISAPQPQPTTATHITTTTTIVPGGNCPRCIAGRIESETDLCCLICLILLTIFTFPVGLVFLCCIPCTVRRRCTHCRRIFE